MGVTKGLIIVLLFLLLALMILACVEPTPEPIRAGSIPFLSMAGREICHRKS